MTYSDTLQISDTLCRLKFALLVFHRQQDGFLKGKKRGNTLQHREFTRISKIWHHVCWLWENSLMTTSCLVLLAAPVITFLVLSLLLFFSTPPILFPPPFTQHVLVTFLLDIRPNPLFKARENGENVTSFWGMAFVASDMGRPWTGWIGPAPVQMSGCCLGAALSWLCDGLLQGFGRFFIDLSFFREQ